MSLGSSISYRRDAPFATKIKKCGVYGFLDLELPSDYYKHLLNDLHEENKALNRMNKISGVMEDSSKRMSNNSNNQMVKDLKADLTFVKSELKMYDRLLLVVVLCVVFLSLDVYEEDEINTCMFRSTYRWLEKDTTDEDSTDKDITDKNTTDEDTVDESYFPKSKGKNVQRAKNPTLKVIFKSPIPIKGCMIGLVNVQTWDNIVKKFGIRNLRNCEDTRKGYMIMPKKEQKMEMEVASNSSTLKSKSRALVFDEPIPSMDLASFCDIILSLLGLSWWFPL
ncbi:hypothetical protein Tco_0843859 [Tanacetum coccineum]